MNKTEKITEFCHNCPDQWQCRRWDAAPCPMLEEFIEKIEKEEECADVMIMAEQVAIMFGYAQVEAWKKRKLERLGNIINGGNAL